MAGVEDGLLPDWSSLHINRGDLGGLDPFDQGGEGVLYTVSSITGPLPSAAPLQRVPARNR